jgi:hypothetical protein
MMLSEARIERVWQGMVGAEIRELTIDNAIVILDDLTDHGRELSKSATAFPNDKRAMLKWEEHVLAHRLQPQT